MIHRELVNDRNLIPMTLQLPGNYLVGFTSHSGQVLETKKLVVTGELIRSLKQNSRQHLLAGSVPKFVLYYL